MIKEKINQSMTVRILLAVIRIGREDWAFHVSSCVVFGRAKLIEDRKITEEKVRKFARKYYPSVEEVEEVIKRSINAVQLVAIEIEHISGKRVHEK